ncbi:hypothetical protein JI739_07755 [Ramlibacter sp. AW1]|uniref:Uncharacterized protein n=1 Tax=Ramlibacter aurantiacus TaxID=2801330 RepID=A0A936ZMX3_9BURK|nr:hypothetical protein [Ramlibacter aurantiacus]MBL0420235.1 hypothetical protein [Ramlibacter aurantiacus]
MKPDSLVHLAWHLGVAPSNITKLARRGMPTDDVEAAHEWRARNVGVYIRARPGETDLLREAKTLGVAAVGRPDAVEALRNHYLSLPYHLQLRVRLPMAAWDALTGFTPDGNAQ